MVSCSGNSPFFKAVRSPPLPPPPAAGPVDEIYYEVRRKRERALIGYCGCLLWSVYTGGDDQDSRGARILKITTFFCRWNWLHPLT